jgi:hypothetical protein
MLLPASNSGRKRVSRENDDSILYCRSGALILLIGRIGSTLEIGMAIESVKYNAEIPKDKFDLPGEIKALLKKPAK